MNRKTLIVLGIAGVIALGGAVSDANAVCGVAQIFNLAFSGSGNPDNALVFPAEANNALSSGLVKGRWWQAGARNLHNEGSDCPESTYLIQSDGTLNANVETVYGAMAGDWGAGPCGGVGCPVGTMVLLVQTTDNAGTKSYYAIGKTNQLSDGSYDFTRGGVNWPVVEVPRPRVTSSSRGGSTVTVNLSFDAPAGARGESDAFPANTILSGYQLVRFEGQADPGRAPAAWTNLGAVIPVGATGATAAGIGLVCSGTTDDVFIATRNVYDNGQFPGDYVSASTRIECDPAIADPRFNMIDRTKSGRGTIKTNR